MSEPIISVLSIRIFNDELSLKGLADIRIDTEYGYWIIRDMRIKIDRQGNLFVKEPKLGYKDPETHQLVFRLPVSIPSFVMGIASDAVKSEYFKAKGEQDGNEIK